MFSSGCEKQFGTLAFIFTALLLLVGVTASPTLTGPQMLLPVLVLRCVVLRCRAKKQFKVS